jgi:UDP-N-acetylglucosamine 2-epimerase
MTVDELLSERCTTSDVRGRNFQSHEKLSGGKCFSTSAPFVIGKVLEKLFVSDFHRRSEVVQKTKTIIDDLLLMLEMRIFHFHHQNENYREKNWTLLKGEKKSFLKYLIE